MPLMGKKLHCFYLITFSFQNIIYRIRKIFVKKKKIDLYVSVEKKNRITAYLQLLRISTQKSKNNKNKTYRIAFTLCFFKWRYNTKQRSF